MIDFNVPAVIGPELTYLWEAVTSGQLCSDGAFSRRCNEWITEHLDVPGALLVHSCTAALEMAALLCDLQPGDEVLMPSFTFPSTATAVALRGAVPVFVDIRSDTLNVDETLLESAITERSRAIFPVHYAGVCAEMDEIMRIAAKHRLLVVEDAAQALGSSYRGRPAGALGDLGCFSFHETKNVIAGEGGALVTANPRLFARAEIIRDKGTNRQRFLDGEVDKYIWVDLGSSYAPGELVAAFLLGQLENIGTITQRRLQMWNRYHAAFEQVEETGQIRRPVVPEQCKHNGHLYYLLLEDAESRDTFIRQMRSHGMETPFHYVPLHGSPAGKRFGRSHGSLSRTEDLSARLVRLPLHLSLGEDQERVIETALACLESSRRTSSPSRNRGDRGTGSAT